MALDKVVAALVMIAAHSDFTSAAVLLNNDAPHLDLRALPNSPSGNYSPQVVPCPSTPPTIRSAATGLGQDEKSFLSKRRAAVVQPMTDFMRRANIAGFDAQSYLSNASAVPNIAIAFSGGGYRALMNGAGFVSAADDRTPGTTAAGGIGGLLQSATYVAGLSGGGWLVGSLYSNNFSSVTDIQQNANLWQFQHSVFVGPASGGGLGVLRTAEYWNDVHDQVDEKSDPGYETSVTDYWGRALSYQLVNAPDGGLAYTWSSIGLDQNLTNGNIPMPILVSDGRDPGITIVSLNATNYELGPWEIGTFDPTVYGFVPTRYVGSNFSGGSIANGGSCVEGFDQAGFVMGTSSTLFNEFLTTNISTVANVPQIVADAITALQNKLSKSDNDIAQWIPNPFQGFNPATNPIANTNQLSLVDGGEDLQNIPMNPLIQPQRAVDVIFAVDSSADTTNNWPNGTALRASYQRSLAPIANGTHFPAVPDAHTFVNLGLNYRPAFFGCDAANFTTQPPPPLIVYLPNAPYTTTSNVTTFDPTYELQQRDDIIANGLNAATQGNGTLDAAWPACVACAALSRSFTRTGATVPSGCASCFARYCWNGTLDAADRGRYEPALRIGNESRSSAGSESKSAGARTVRREGLWAVVLGVVVAGVLV